MRHARSLTALVALSLIAGCGGGGPTNPPDNGSPVGGGGDGGNGDGSGGGGGSEGPAEWSPQEQMDAIDEVQATVASVLPSGADATAARDPVAEIEDLADALEALDEVVAVAIYRTTGVAQAVLADGTTVLIINNRFDGVDEPDPVGGAEVLPPAVAGPPGSPTAVAVAIDGGDGVASEVGGKLSGAGYELSSLGGSLDDMRNYQDLGALYLDTHGATFLPAGLVTKPDGTTSVAFNSPTRFALQTNTVVSTSALSSMRTELLAGDVVVSFVGATAKLAITESFIQKHWSFENGVVMLHACYAGSVGDFNPSADCVGDCDLTVRTWNSAAVRDAIVAAGADVLVSFDGYTEANFARPSMMYFFDRMLGTNSIDPPDPPVRPFDAAQVYDAMEEEGLLEFNRPEQYLGPIEWGGNVATLTFHGSMGDAMLAPSIRRVEIVDDAAESTGRLELQGQFGEDQGEVEVSGRDVQVESWSSQKVVARVPFDGFAGDVIARAPGDVESNPVPLTEWIGTMTFDFIPGEGTAKAEASVDVRFRADVHRYRETLDGEPVDPGQLTAYISPASEGSVKGSGSYSEGNTTVKYTGESPIEVLTKAQVDGPPIQPNPFSDRSIFGGKAILDPSAGTARVCVMIQGSITLELDTGGPTISTDAVLLLTFIELFDTLEGGLACLDLPLQEGSFTIPSGQRNVFVEDGSARLQWTSFEPVARPDEDTPS